LYDVADAVTVIEPTAVNEPPSFLKKLSIAPLLALAIYILALASDVLVRINSAYPVPPVTKDMPGVNQPVAVLPKWELPELSMRMASALSTKKRMVELDTLFPASALKVRKPDPPLPSIVE